MPAEVASIAATLFTAGGVVWYLSYKISQLTSADGNMKEDVTELKATVNHLSEEVAEIKGFLQPERVSVVPTQPRKRTRSR